MAKNILDYEDILNKYRQQMSPSAMQVESPTPAPEEIETELPEEMPQPAPQPLAQDAPVVEKPLEDYISEYKALQQAKQDRLRQIALFEAADQVGRGFAAGYGGRPEKTDVSTLKDIAEGPLKDYLDLKKQKTASTGKGFQQSQYVTKQGDPVTFDPITNSYVNALTGDKVESGNVKRNYIKTIVDPKTGEIKSVGLAPGEVETVAGSSPSEPSKDKKEEVDYTYEMLNPKQRDFLGKQETEFRKEAMESIEFGEILVNIEDLVGSDISAAIPAIKRQLARSVGKEVGVMTDADVAAFSGDQSFLAALERFAKIKLIDGKMPERDKKQFQGIIDIARRNLGRAVDNRANYYVSKIKNRIPDASDSSIRDLLSVEASQPMGMKKTQDSNYVRMRLPSGSIKRIPKENVEKAKERGAKVLD